MTVFVEFLGFFAFNLILGYLAPAGFYYWMYQVREYKGKEELRIQHRRPAAGQIAREVKLSILSVFIFSVMATGFLQLYKLGWTNIYFRFRDYPVGYVPASIFMCLVFHDTYFYWTHRVMHWRPVFKYFHADHHRSVCPTPWAIYAFQPGEAIMQFFGLCVMAALIPLHPLAILGFLWLDTQMNTGGHTGFELIPKSVSRHWLFQGFNTVTHHDTHHTNMTKNFGSFFNVWDRWMGTFDDEVTPPDSPAVEPIKQQTVAQLNTNRNPVNEMVEVHQ